MSSSGSSGSYSRELLGYFIYCIVKNLNYLLS